MSNDLFFDVLAELMRDSRIAQSTLYTQHGDTSVLLHSVAVAYYSARAFAFLGVPCRERELLRGALLHDYFLYDWHIPDENRKKHAFWHARAAYENARRDLRITDLESEIVLRHMFPVTPIPPRHREAWMVCLIDKCCSVYETFHPGAYPELRRGVALARP